MTSNKTAGQNPGVQILHTCSCCKILTKLNQFYNIKMAALAIACAINQTSTSVLHESLGVSPWYMEMYWKALTRHTQVITVAF